MGHANKRNGYFEARYAIGGNKYEAVRDKDGNPVRYQTKRAAEQAADHAEIEYRQYGRIGGTAIVVRDPSDMLFADWAEEWYAEQDLARTTMTNYKCHLEHQLLPEFGEKWLTEITPKCIVEWIKKLRAARYSEESIRTWRATLYVMLEDAKEAGKVTANVAKRKRRRGRKVRPSRGYENGKVISDNLTGLLIAERMALLSGRDDEFVWVILDRYTGLRLGELRGLEKQFIPANTPAERTKKRHTLRVEWQLIRDKNEFFKEPPKENSRRDVDLPHFLWLLLVEHLNRAQPVPCPCHGNTYVFTGHGKRRSSKTIGKVTLRDVGEQAGVSAATASIAMRGGAAEDTRIRVLKAAAELGYNTRGAADTVWHQSGTSLYQSLYTPAVSGWYPDHGKRRRKHPVPIRQEAFRGVTVGGITPFPGVPVRGKDATGQANSCWLPIAEGMTPHGNRHSHRTDMEELGIPKKLIDDRIGHLDGSVQARYTHVTDRMRDNLVDLLTERWLEALDARLAISPTSPVAVLDRLLKARAADRSQLLAA